MRRRKKMFVIILIATILLAMRSSVGFPAAFAEDGDPPPGTAYGGDVTEDPPESDLSTTPVTEVRPEDADLVDQTTMSEPVADESVVVETISIEPGSFSTPMIANQANPARETPGIEGSFGNFVADNFNREDGSLGSDWTQQSGSCSIVGNQVTCGGTHGLATLNFSPSGIDSIEMDVQVSGGDIQYGAMVMNYAPGEEYVFVKVQREISLGFNKAACYKNNFASETFGLGIFPLTSPFTSAHMITSRAGDTVTLKFTDIDGGTQPDQIYVCEGAPPVNGDMIGIGGYDNHTKMDNFAISQGPRVLLLGADLDVYGNSPLQAALEEFGDLGEVDVFEATNATPELSLLRSYDVVITWSYGEYDNPVLLGNRLADYVDAGGKVINKMFAMGSGAISMKGRFIKQGYTALNGGAYVYGDVCMTSYNGNHPVMNDVTFVCEMWRVKDTYLTPGSKSVAKWDDGEIFVAVKQDRSVVSIAGYSGEDYAWSGQMFELIHNSINWLYHEGDVLWEQLYHPDYQTIEIVNQEMEDPAWDAYTCYVADDFLVEGPWRIRSIFMPGGWSSNTNLANATRMNFWIYEDAGGVPAGDPSGGGEPHIIGWSGSIINELLTLYSGTSDTTTNVYSRIPMLWSYPDLEPGHYWLVATPSMTYPDFGQFGSLQARTVNGYPAQWINPGGGWGKGADWQNWSVVGASEHDMAFRIEGEAYDLWIPLITK